jgi:hypothetical protein
MNKSRTNKLQNFLVNNYGITREKIFEHIDKRVQDLLDKHVKNYLNSNSFENLVIDKLCQYVNKGSCNRYYDRSSFEDVVRGQIKQVILDTLSKQSSITFSFRNSLDFLREDK